jgi:hypothetical protein
MRVIFLAITTAIFSPSAFAFDLNADVGGAICRSQEALTAFMRTAAKEPKPGDDQLIIQDCQIIKPGQRVSVESHITRNGSMMGTGTVYGNSGSVVGTFLLLDQQTRSDTPPPKISTTDIRKLSSRDLGVQTRKWDGRTVEGRMSCFYADKDEFRCIAGTARLDLSNITPLFERQKIEKECDTIDRSERSVCTVNLRFVWKSSSMRNLGLRQQHMIVAVQDTAEIVPAPRRKR